MKKSALFMILILLIPFASAVFEGWVADMETFRAEGHYFYVAYIESSQSLIFKMDDIGGLMSVGECETRGDIRYCFEEVDYPEIKVRIESMEPDVSIGREFSSSSLYLNEELDVKVTLKNTGTKDAADVFYTDTYPSGLTVLPNKQTASWSGSLDAGEEEVFSYKVRADDIVSFDSEAQLSYYSGSKKKVKKSSQETIDVKKPYTIAHSVSKKAADKDELISYNISIKNKDSSNDLDITSLEIGLPSSVDIVSLSSGMDIRDGKPFFSGAVEKGKSRDFTVKISSSRAGKFNISSSVALNILEKGFTEEFEDQLSVGLSYILPIIEVQEEVKSNSPYNVYIAVKNYGEKDISGVKVKVESSLFKEISEKADISSGETHEIFRKTLTSPYLSEDHKFNTKVTGSYLSDSGKTISFEKSAQLMVKAQPQIIEIIRELNKKEFYPGEEIKVAVILKNQRNQVINSIDISDMFPKEIRSSLVGNVIGFLDGLDPNEEVKAYSYSLLVPEGYEEDDIEFKTVVNAKFNEEMVILKRIDKVKVLKEEEEAINASEELQTSGGKDETPYGKGDKGDILEEKGAIGQKENLSGEGDGQEVKQPIFSKVISWIRSLFRKK